MGKGIAGPVGSEQSISVRKIDNGYVTSKTTYGPKGYKCEEVYSKTAPQVVVQAEPKTRAKASPNALAKAVKILK